MPSVDPRIFKELIDQIAEYFGDGYILILEAAMEKSGHMDLKDALDRLVSGEVIEVEEEKRREFFGKLLCELYDVLGKYVFMSLIRRFSQALRISGTSLVELLRKRGFPIEVRSSPGRVEVQADGECLAVAVAVDMLGTDVREIAKSDHRFVFESSY